MTVGRITNIPEVKRDVQYNTEPWQANQILIACCYWQPLMCLGSITARSVNLLSLAARNTGPVLHTQSESGDERSDDQVIRWSGDQVIRGSGDQVIRGSGRGYRVESFCRRSLDDMRSRCMVRVMFIRWLLPHTHPSESGRERNHTHTHTDTHTHTYRARHQTFCFTLKCQFWKKGDI